uniref:Uncharacterized protein n=1 Tax=Cucumis sativus TaxID=3659 RepID=A0A0A0LPI8_CUCSA
MVGSSRKWAYIRIITGTVVGGVLGFYVMHRVEVGYKEKMKERAKVEVRGFSALALEIDLIRTLQSFHIN